MVQPDDPVGQKGAAMSWDVVVQDLPPQAKSIEDIPDDFDPQPIGRRTWIVDGIRAVAPFADFSKPDWIAIAGDDFSIEIGLPAGEEIESFAFHASGGDAAAAVIADILAHLRLRALDPSSPSGLFSPGPQAAEAMRRWRAYRDRVVRGTAGA